MGTPPPPTPAPKDPHPSRSPDPDSPVVHAHQVTKAYDGRPVLRGVSFTVHPGERVALVGPSGSGKTTLLNALGGVDRPDQGSIHIAGHRLESLDPAGLAHLRRTHIGTVFQFFHLLPTLSAFENVELPLQLNGVPTHERLQRVQNLLARVRVDHRAHARPAQLSGGEQQRIAIARALIHRPAVLLADEPTGNLDSTNGANILTLLRELTDETRTALVLVTHSPEATAICHRTITLRDGLVIDTHP